VKTSNDPGKSKEKKHLTGESWAGWGYLKCSQRLFPSLFFIINGWRWNKQLWRQFRVTYFSSNLL